MEMIQVLRNLLTLKSFPNVRDPIYETAPK